ncbi:MAG UNVERIFIED_CONTAM: hypothetical protein LVQ98_08565 [Rickettsiaceae bacterium]
MSHMLIKTFIYEDLFFVLCLIRYRIQAKETNYNCFYTAWAVFLTDCLNYRYISNNGYRNN